LLIETGHAKTVSIRSVAEGGDLAVDLSALHG
jgi:hypothetical protein